MKKSTSKVNHKVLSDFYLSEKIVIGSQDFTAKSVLDIGGACCGLGFVLKESFNVQNYVCIERDEESCEVGKMLNRSAEFFCPDFLNLSQNDLSEKKFVFALSSLDWNTKFVDLLDLAWLHVKPRGVLILSWRATIFSSGIKINESYQYINFQKKEARRLFTKL